MAVKTKKKSSKKKQGRVIHYKKHLEDSQITALKKKIKDLSDEMKKKDLIIKNFKTQFSSGSEIVLKLTQQVDRDLQNLYSLHENLIPLKFPSIPNCEFSFKFVSAPKGEGKDFYQVFPLKKMRFGVMMSSCVSHIVSSLLFSSRLKLMSKMENKSAPPGEILQMLSEEMGAAPHSSSMNVDIFYAVMNRKTYRLAYSSVGQVKSFVYSASTKKIKELEPSRSSLNKEPDNPFLSQKVSFNSRDRLILCSPGVIQALNKKGEPFGEERLKEAILAVKTPGPHQLRSEIFHALKAFSQNKKPKRDQSVIVMEIKDRILKLA